MEKCFKEQSGYQKAWDQRTTASSSSAVWPPIDQLASLGLPLLSPEARYGEIRRMKWKQPGVTPFFLPDAEQNPNPAPLCQVLSSSQRRQFLGLPGRTRLGVAGQVR